MVKITEIPNHEIEINDLGVLVVRTRGMEQAVSPPQRTEALAKLWLAAWSGMPTSPSVMKMPVQAPYNEEKVADALMSYIVDDGDFNSWLTEFFRSSLEMKTCANEFKYLLNIKGLIEL